MFDFPLRLYAGSSHPELAQEIGKFLRAPVSEMVLKRFACNEIFARPVDTVRGCDVFVVQTATDKVNEDFMELFIIIDALKRSFADRVHVVIPHFGYARQDRVASPREPITAKLIANLLDAAGADHVITINLHSDQEQGFFNFPVDNLSSNKLFVEYFKSKKLSDLIVVAPDTGAVKSAKRFADALGAEIAILHKTRPEHNVAEITEVVGDVKNKTCLIFDDMIDTAGTVVTGKEALIQHGANPDIYLAATHAVFSDPAVSRLKSAGFKEVVVTNTIPIPEEKMFDELTIISVAGLLAKIIQNVHKAKSVTEVI